MTDTSAITTYDEWYALLCKLWDDGNMAEALEVATREKNRFNDNPLLTAHFRACLISLLHHDAQQATAVLAEALGDDQYYTDDFWDDGDFDVIRDAPVFQQLRATSATRRAAAQAAVRAELLTVTPRESGPRPVMVALHGNRSNIAEESKYWRGLAAHGWLVAMPQAETVSQPGMYDWNDVAQTDALLKAHFATLQRAYAVDEGQVVAGGFSMGAETAIRLTLASVVPSRGFIAICPGGPYTHATPEKWDALLEAARGRAMHGVMIVGGREPGRDNILKLGDRLQAGGVTLQVHEYPAMLHDYPPDFASRLPEWLAFVLGA
jgi:dienelactone hydrolase